MKNTLLRLTLCLALLASFSSLKAQVSAPTANYTYRLVDDTGAQVSMPVYIFFASDPNAEVGTLTVAAGADAYQWYKLDSQNATYVPVPAANGGNTNTVSGLGEGGYKVTLTMPAGTTTLFAWVVVDALTLGDIATFNQCDGLRLELNMLSYRHTIAVFDLSTDSSPTQDGSGSMRQYNIFSEIKCSWTSSVNIHEGVENPSEAWKETQLFYTVISAPPPLFNASYSVTISNAFGNKAVQVVNGSIVVDGNGNPLLTHATPVIPAIAVYPSMRIEELKDNVWMETVEPHGSALYRLRFNHSKSINADTYAWVGYNNNLRVQTRGRILWADTVTDRYMDVYPRYMHLGRELDGYLPGEYPIKLVVSNRYGCIDSIPKPGVSLVIKVDPSKFDPKSMPNVFTPNGDGINDVFKFVKGQEPVSLNTIDLRIFDRGGRELYRYAGDASEWKGWNGRVNGTGADCTSGVYYYLISARGWDEESFGGQAYRGYVHLFRK